MPELEAGSPPPQVRRETGGGYEALSRRFLDDMSRTAALPFDQVVINIRPQSIEIGGEVFYCGPPPLLAALCEAVPLAEHIVGRGCWAAAERRLAAAGAIGVRRQCRLLGIPWAARRVAREACSTAVAQALRRLGPSTFAQCLPEGAAEIRQWARAVTRAGSGAVWMAHNWQTLRELPARPLDVADYLAHRAEPPHRSASAAAVLEKSRDCHREIFVHEGVRYHRASPAELRDTIRELQIGLDAWLADPELPGRIDPPFAGALPLRLPSGHELHLLLSRQAVVEEGEAMRNCLRWPDDRYEYWAAIARGRWLLGSLRLGGERVATMAADPGAGSLVEVNGPGRAGVGDEVAQAAAAFAAWLGDLARQHGGG